MKRLILILSLVFGFTAMYVAAPSALAQVVPLEGACNAVNPDERPEICNTPDEDPITGSDGDGIIIKAADVVAIVTGVIAVFVLIIAGMQFIMSAGEPNKVNSAKQAIILAAVGLVVVLVARVVVAFIIRRL